MLNPLEKEITLQSYLEFLDTATYNELQEIARRAYYLKMQIDREKAIMIA